MFTGIITDIGSVKSVEETDGGKRIAITTALDISNTDLGASIACAGACMTVVEKGDNWFQVDVSAESLSKTTIGNWALGHPVNLEMALKMGDELGGHIVSGHVDGLGRIKSITPAGESLILEIEVSSELGRLIAPKGSVTIDGVSLTTNEISIGNEGGSHIFTINIIPHTQQMTTLGKLCAGDKVNVEIDTLARYVARLQDTK